MLDQWAAIFTLVLLYGKTQEWTVCWSQCMSYAGKNAERLLTSAIELAMKQFRVSKYNKNNSKEMEKLLYIDIFWYLIICFALFRPSCLARWLGFINASLSDGNLSSEVTEAPCLAFQNRNSCWPNMQIGLWGIINTLYKNIRDFTLMDGNKGSETKANVSQLNSYKCKCKSCYHLTYNRSLIMSFQIFMSLWMMIKEKFSRVSRQLIPSFG